MTRKLYLIEKKEFAAITLDLNYKAFVIYITVLNICFDISNKIYPSKTGLHKDKLDLNKRVHQVCLFCRCFFI